MNFNRASITVLISLFLLISVTFMNFCPLCFRLLLVENSTTGNRLVCTICRYFYPLTRTQKKVIHYNIHADVEVVEENQDLKSLPIAQTLCPKCSFTKAYYQQRQTRSADQASTLFYTCQQCEHKWAEY